MATGRPPKPRLPGNPEPVGDPRYVTAEVLKSAVEEFQPPELPPGKPLPKQFQPTEKHVKMGVRMGAGTVHVTSDDVMKEAMSGMMGDLNRPEFNQAFQSITAGVDFSGQANAAAGDGADDTAALFRTLAIESGADGAQSIAQTMEILQKLSSEADNLGPGGLPGPGISSESAAAAEGMSDELINRMMKEFEGMGKKDDFASVVDGMMRQLLSKDIMYLPMKAMAEEFPEWLAVHGSSLSREQYESYGRMYQTFQKMVDTYETQPDNFPRLLELMQDMQECGNPPVEIVAKLAPGLQLGPDGMPSMLPNMGAGMPQVPGLPAAGGGCSIQ